MIEYVQKMWQLALRGELEGVWFWAAVYSFILGAYSLAMQLRTRRWPWVEGELLGAGVKKFGATDNVRSEQDYKAGALYQYEVAGHRYDGARVSPWKIVATHNARAVLQMQLSGIQQITERTAKVFYNPGNPKKSFLVVAGIPGLIVTLAVCLLPAVLFALRFLS